MVEPARYRRKQSASWRALCSAISATVASESALLPGSSVTPAGSCAKLIALNARHGRLGSAVLGRSRVPQAASIASSGITSKRFFGIIGPFQLVQRLGDRPGLLDIGTELAIGRVVGGLAAIEPQP